MWEARPGMLPAGLSLCGSLFLRALYWWTVLVRYRWLIYSFGFTSGRLRSGWVARGVCVA